MGTGSITEYIDVAQLVLYGFWVFFAGLIYYLRREDKREGYPLESDRSEHIRVVGFPGLPRPKRYALPHGGHYVTPNEKADTRTLAAEPVAPWPGAPIAPTGNPMIDGIGPASYAQRDDLPDLTIDGSPRIVPVRVATEFSVEPRDPDPRGMQVLGFDGRVGGVVRDLWVDRSELMLRYLEIEVTTGDEAARRPVLLPITMARVDRSRGQVRVASILASQFVDVPPIRKDDRITRLEEDKICAYYAGGHLYAVPSRAEALL